MLRLIGCQIVLSASFCVCVVAEQPSEVPVRRIELNGQSEFSACAIVDVNRDGQPDIFCGGFWYEGPTWARRTTRDVTRIRGRYDDYSNLPLDVNGDQWPDIVSVNYRSRSLYWVENPAQSHRPWQTHLIDTPGPSETGLLVDLNADGQADVLPNGTRFAAWYELRKPQWVQHSLPEEIAGHGIGAGDIDGDGRNDIVTSDGWWTQSDGRWRRGGHFRLHSDASVPILIHDVDADGDADVIWGRGHNVGVYWMERDAANDTWIRHAIDTSWSCCHTLLLADLDGDQSLDLVAGKRYLGHDGKDPGETDPLAIYLYRYQSMTKTWHRQQLSYGSGCGMDLDAAAGDIDLDGDVDVVAPARSGLWILENLRIDSRTEDDSAIVGDTTNDSESAEHMSAVYKPGQPLLDGIDRPDEQSRPIPALLQWGNRRQQILSAMQQVMGQLPNSSERVPLDIVVHQTESTADYKRHRISFASDANSRVTAFLLVPNEIGKPRPAILCLHPTSPLGKAQICGLGGKPSRFYAHELAKRGYVCLAPDYPSFGDYDYDFQANRSRYASGTMKAVWDNLRALDLLERLPEVDPDRIAAVGHSLGGHNALFTAAFDLRIRALVTSCGFNAFEDYYDGDLRGWTSDRYMPRIAEKYGSQPDRMPFDFDAILAALAPRPVFINAPLRDANFPVVGVYKSVASAQPVYRLFDASDRLRAEHPDSEHDFPEPVRTAAYQWLDESLGFAP